MEGLINLLKSWIPKAQQEKILHFIAHSKIAGFAVSIFFGRNLTLLAQIYRTDKWGNHFYTSHYQFHFQSKRKKKIALLEIGVGGYADPAAGGNSLRMWKRYFTKGQIYSLDIYDKSPHEENRIRIFKGSQVDDSFFGI